MKILLTGASSFTGFWFARTLSEAGHEVVAPLQRAADGYAGDVRARRVQGLKDYARCVWNCEFGGESFLALAADGKFDLLCHHAAYVQDYRSPKFDVAAALRQNTQHLDALLEILGKGGLKGVVLTGSVFEQNEGAGSLPHRAFSPYGLSKAFTMDVFDYWCGERNIPLGKFVIPNPFGPFEEPRFCAYLVKTWKEGKSAEVRTPLYVRDNIFVDLLALAYERFCAGLFATGKSAKINPSGYVETQGAFTTRFASEMRSRLGLECKYALLEQKEFPEPVTRINTMPATGIVSGWSEARAWDSLAAYYAET